MNCLERVKAVLAGQIPDRVTVCLQDFIRALLATAREEGVYE
jgi:hypothetical protein